MRPRRASALRRRKSDLTRFISLLESGGMAAALHNLRYVFVAASAQIRHNDLAAPQIVTQQPAERVRRLQRGADPLATAQFVQRLEREVVAAVVVLDAADRLQIGVLRSDRRIVESRGDRVRLGDLPELVLQDHRARAVQHAERAAGETRGVLAEVVAAAAGLRSEE